MPSTTSSLEDQDQAVTAADMAAADTAAAAATGESGLTSSGHRNGIRSLRRISRCLSDAIQNSVMGEKTIALEIQGDS